MRLRKAIILRLCALQWPSGGSSGLAKGTTLTHMSAVFWPNPKSQRDLENGELARGLWKVVQGFLTVLGPRGGS